MMKNTYIRYETGLYIMLGVIHYHIVPQAFHISLNYAIIQKLTSLILKSFLATSKEVQIHRTEKICICIGNLDTDYVLI